MFLETPFQLTVVTSTSIDIYKHLDEDQRRSKKNGHRNNILYLLCMKNEWFGFFLLLQFMVHKHIFIVN